MLAALTKHEKRGRKNLRKQLNLPYQSARGIYTNLVSKFLNLFLH